jgi:phosphoribosylglycinamide formyltransferase-1
VSDPLAIGVLASGAGTNLQALIDQVHGREARIVGVASNRPDAQALHRAERAGIDREAFPLRAGEDRSQRDARMAGWLCARGARLVVLAGYMQLLGPSFLDRFPDAVINVHPSLLPAFPGLQAIEPALAYGARVFGVSVHFVDAGVDTGPIIAQGVVEIRDEDDESALHERIKEVERTLLVDVVGRLARNGYRIEGRKVVIQ